MLSKMNTHIRCAIGVKKLKLSFETRPVEEQQTMLMTMEKKRRNKLKNVENKYLI